MSTIALWYICKAIQANIQPKLCKRAKFSTRNIEYLEKDCIFGENCPDLIFKKYLAMTVKESFGEHIKNLREESGLPLRKVAALLDIDPSTLSKIERGERSANKEMLPILADLFKEKEEMLDLILLSDKVAYVLMEEDNPNRILKVAEEKIKYLKNKNLKQGSIDFD